MGKTTDPSLGAKPKTEKKPNELKQKAKEDREKGPVVDLPEAQIDEKGEFGDFSLISKDWRLDDRAVVEVQTQKREDCWAKTLARLLHAAFNLDKSNPYSKFNADDLVAHLKSKEKSKKVASLELKNIKTALAHIKTKGILTAGGKNKAGSSMGRHEKWDFGLEENATADFIKGKVDESPVAISFHVDNAFQTLKNDIYEVKIIRREEPEYHMVLVVGYGYTKDNKLFFLIQNSWGKNWGVKGYGGIFIRENSGATVIYP